MAQYTQRAICQTFVKMLEHMPLKALCEAVQRSVDCRPEAIIERFGLKRPIFSRVSCYGHFGINAAMPWEATDLEFKL